MHPPVALIDFDDVLVVNSRFGPMHLADPPPGFWDSLFHVPAVQTLDELFRTIKLHSVITSSWLRFLDRRAAEALLYRTGLHRVADSLHPSWDAPQNYGQTRLAAISTWLDRNPHSDFVVLDDRQSGTGLEGSNLDRQARIVFCDVGVGLHRGLLPAIYKALRLAVP